MCLLLPQQIGSFLRNFHFDYTQVIENTGETLVGHAGLMGQAG
jgi:hypothetical protein